MKKTLLLLCLALTLSACGAEPDAWDDLSDTHNLNLTVFADASLTDALSTLAARYQEAHPRTRLRFQFDASGTLQRQIQQGADCDLFLSAASGPMDALDGDFRGDWVRNPESLDLLLEDSRVSLIENQLVLAVPAGNPRGIRNFAHMASLIRQENLLLAAADSADPLGTYTKQIFDYYLLRERPLSRTLALAGNARETAVLVRSDMADGGIVYRSDADGLEIVESADVSLFGKVTYCGAVLAESERTREASAFLDYLTGAEAEGVFRRAGFTPLSEETLSPDDAWQEEIPEGEWEAEFPDEGGFEGPWDEEIPSEAVFWE